MIIVTPEIYGKLMQGGDNSVCTTPEIYGKLMQGGDNSDSRN
jgi:hypothetical protein